MQNSSIFELNFSLTQIYSIQFDIISIAGEESFCTDYQFNIETICNTAIEMCTENVLGSKAILTRLHELHKIQHHGIITHIISHGVKNDKYHYTLIMHSPLYQLKLTSHLRTFQNKEITAIISEILKDNKWPIYTYRFIFRNIIPTIDYLIQYNKDDFQFIMELLNRYGLFNYFEQQQNYLVWVICDSRCNLPFSFDNNLVFRKPTSLNINSTSIYKMNQKAMLLADHYALNEYNYLTPDTKLNIVTLNRTDLTASGTISLSDRNYTDMKSGTYIANVLQNHIDGNRSQYIAENNYPSLVSGQLINIISHPQTSWNNDYQITKLSYQIYQPILNLADNNSQNVSFKNTMTLTALSPLIQHLRIESQIITAVNLSGLMIGRIYSDIFHQNTAIDEYGRYKVRLVLSTFNDASFNTTLPIRLLQMYGGNHSLNQYYGAHFPLSVGTVVILTFINGDINRPLIMGVLPNSTMPNPVTAQNHTQNRITTISHNEIIFEEKEGIQHISLQNKEKQNYLLLDATENNHHISMTSQCGQLQCYAHDDMYINAIISIYKNSADSHYITINNQHLLHSQQSIELLAGNDMKLISQQNTTLSTVDGILSLNSQSQFITQCGGSYRLQSLNSNINYQILQGNMNCYSYNDIIIHNYGSGHILLKNGICEMVINNERSVILQANSIYLNAPKIVLQKNVLINNIPL